MGKRRATPDILGAVAHVPNAIFCSDVEDSAPVALRFCRFSAIVPAISCTSPANIPVRVNGDLLREGRIGQTKANFHNLRKGVECGRTNSFIGIRRGWFREFDELVT